VYTLAVDATTDEGISDPLLTDVSDLHPDASDQVKEINEDFVDK